ncbi:hypothetical protein H2248_008423 [Termitomyces sp. 'cryptogamus']|nr:hypothetical protein H2248_008423 [Termitomyces sp. 'cryptogamus']
MNPDSSNAVAGPSTSRSSPSPSSASPLFLPPPPPPRTQPTYLHSTQDLLGRFHLLPAYDKYVRPFTMPTETGKDQLGFASVTPGTNGGLDKGKGKEAEGGPVAPVAHEGGDGGDDDGGKGDKKQRNNYKHLIKGIPGKHSMKKDDYLTTMMLVPPKQRIQIAPFDSRTQREAFTVSLEGLKGWNPNALVLESAQAREDRKKRKEAKRLQKLQAQAALMASVVQPQPIPASASATSTSNRPPQNLNPTFNGTPIPGFTAPLARPTPVTAVPPTQLQGSIIQRPGSAVSKPAVPRPGSTVPRPGSTKPLTSVQTTIPRVSTPLRSATTTTPTSAQSYQVTFDVQRGIKRERDDMPVTSLTNGLGVAHVNGLGNGNGVAVSTSKAVINAKAGSAGIRPRPIKKQRMDIQGQARDVTVTQQPTPQGV